jgi:hypothetical protein
MRILLGDKEQTMRGLVIYTSHQYAGIMLIDMNREASRAFFNFLKDQEAPRMVTG